MSKYPTVKLGDVFTLQMGKTPSRSNSEYWKNGTKKWVSIADLTNSSKYIDNTKELITEQAIAKSGIKEVPYDIVIMSFKLSIGKAAITQDTIYTNEAIMAFIPKIKEQFLSSYLYYLFSSKDWSAGTNKAVMGTTLNKSTLSSIEISCPPTEIQKIISRNLDKITDLISKRKEQLAKLDELAKSRFFAESTTTKLEVAA